MRSPDDLLADHLPTDPWLELGVGRIIGSGGVRGRTVVESAKGSNPVTRIVGLDMIVMIGSIPMRLLLLCFHLAVLPGCQTTDCGTGMSTDQWSHVDGSPISWRIEGDTWQVKPGTGSIRTISTFQDVDIELEFLIPLTASGPDATGNSGVYVQNRYEVQILDSISDGPVAHGCGAIYRFKAPDHDVLRERGAWQRFQIQFTAPRFSGMDKVTDARMTVVHNGMVIHDDVAVTRKTGMGDPEGPAPGPIVLQDHGSPILFRSISITPRP